jgi:crotonobetaine/carnitine-CoA ligase
MSVTRPERHRCDVGTLLERQAAEFGENTFVTVVETGETLTYAQFDEEVNRIARGLEAIGVQQGHFVCLMLPNGLEYLLASYALRKLGAVEVAINSEFRGAGLARMLNLTRSSVLITAPRFYEPLETVAADVEHICTLVRTGVEPGRTKPLRGVTVLSFSDLRSDDASPPARTISDLDLATIIFTSGTTGVSKGCMLSHRWTMRGAQGYVDILSMTPEDCMYCIFPLFHIQAAFCEVLPCVVAGARVVLRERFSASRFWDDIVEHGVTCVDMMGSVGSIIMNGPARDDHSVRVVAGGPLPDRGEFRRRFGATVVNAYGSTDAGLVSYETPDDLGPPGSYGRVRDDLYEVRIADEHGDWVPAGERGELWVRSREPGVMMDGYFGMPEATNAAFRYQWFHTGDMARVDDDGRLYYLGRMGDAIRRRGENVSAFEVEEAINTHPDVDDCAAFGVPSELGEEDVMVVVLRRPGATLTAEDVRAHCTGRVARFMVPDRVEVVDEMPLTATGKPAKGELRQRYTQRMEAVTRGDESSAI